jgi:hypothetical protein
MQPSLRLVNGSIHILVPSAPFEGASYVAFLNGESYISKIDENQVDIQIVCRLMKHFHLLPF